MVFIVGGVLELYEPACHFHHWKSQTATFLLPWRAKKLKGKSIKYRVTISFTSKGAQGSSMLQTAFQIPQTLRSTPGMEGRLPFSAIQVQAQVNLYVSGRGPPVPTCHLLQLASCPSIANQAVACICLSLKLTAERATNCALLSWGTDLGSIDGHSVRHNGQ